MVIVKIMWENISKLLNVYKVHVDYCYTTNNFIIKVFALSHFPFYFSWNSTIFGFSMCAFLAQVHFLHLVSPLNCININKYASSNNKLTVLEIAKDTKILFYRVFYLSNIDLAFEIYIQQRAKH